jgi:hypothetical protein
VQPRKRGFGGIKQRVSHKRYAGLLEDRDSKSPAIKQRFRPSSSCLHTQEAGPNRISFVRRCAALPPTKRASTATKMVTCVGVSAGPKAQSSPTSANCCATSDRFSAHAESGYLRDKWVHASQFVLAESMYLHCFDMTARECISRQLQPMPLHTHLRPTKKKGASWACYRCRRWYMMEPRYMLSSK